MTRRKYVSKYGDRIFKFFLSYSECKERCARDGRKIPAYDEFVSPTFDPLVRYTSVDQNLISTDLGQLLLYRYAQLKQLSNPATFAGAAWYPFPFVRRDTQCRGNPMPCRSMIPVDGSLYEYLWVDSHFDYNSSPGFSMTDFPISEITCYRSITMYVHENRSTF